MKIRKTYYTVSAPLDKQIVLLSDIHYYSLKMKPLLDLIYEELSNQNMDYICIPGDFIDERVIYDEDIFLEFLKKLSSLAPLILSIGNHEAKMKNDRLDTLNEDFLAKIKKLENVHLLNNQSFIHHDIRFTGLRFPRESYDEVKTSEQSVLKVLEEHYPNGLRKDKYNIVLSHSPYLLLYPSIQKHAVYQHADLILSGHTHAGLTPTFICNRFGRAFITPQRHLFPKNSYGYLKKYKTIVSSGITKLSHFNPFRMFNFLYPSEIVFITLKKES